MSGAPDTGAAGALGAVGAMSAVDVAGAVDARNPWLGLASFTEETRQYFFGRDEEIAELARRVQRKLLTVLFGQSGLGKTSILRAGLVPRLRDQGYCPVYVRVDYGPQAPAPAEQIKRAIADAARGSGEWTRTGVAAAGESLWEFLHHRDDVLRDEHGQTLIPLLIFDQFEEIFTLAQGDEAGRANAARFVADLADLVENRPPAALEARLEHDDSAADRFDFARSDYRVLIALREDYLAQLESLKAVMPSVTQNRLRVAPMTGTQALEAVMRPGRGLVTEDVAAAIVRFVAGGTELANAEVEPALLSLICRELNDARLAEGRDDISLDLLEGSHATILSNFYERALADQPAAVRRIVEDELLTASGFRENVAEERLIASLAEAGAPPGTLATLVNCRLLRIEERLDIRRVELTHDVLCGVVKASRDLRREREAREASERNLREQQAREQAARRELARARRIAAGCVLLAVAAVVAAGFAVESTQRARRAERLAQQTREQSEQARAGAERLLGYLSDDFVNQLENSGGNAMIAEFSKRQIDYFHSLPESLRDRDTTRDAALALYHYTRAERQLGDLVAGLASADEAIKLLEGLRARGDDSEATVVAMAQAYVGRGMILDNRNDPQGHVMTQRAVDLLTPLAARADASVAVRKALAFVLMRRGFELQSRLQFAAATAPLAGARRLALELGGEEDGAGGTGEHLDMTALLSEIDAWETARLVQAGSYVDGEKAADHSIAAAERVLARQPGHRLALHGEGVASGELAAGLASGLYPEDALRYSERNVAISDTLVKLDPNSTTSQNNAGVAQRGRADALWALGRLRESMSSYRRALDYFGMAARTGAADFVIALMANASGIGDHLAQIGDVDEAQHLMTNERPFIDALKEGEGSASPIIAMVNGGIAGSEGYIAFARDDYTVASARVAVAVDTLRRVQPVGSFQNSERDIILAYTLVLRGRLEYLRGDFAAAERDLREAIALRHQWADQGIGDRRELAGMSAWLAMSLARLNRPADALREITPTVAALEEFMRKNHGDRWLPVEYAEALSAQALADPPRRGALLARAAALVDAAPASIRETHDVRLWRRLVREAGAAR